MSKWNLSDNYEFEGESLTITQHANKRGLNPLTVYSRLKSENWTLEEALTTPPNGRRRKYANKKEREEASANVLSRVGDRLNQSLDKLLQSIKVYGREDAVIKLKYLIDAHSPTVGKNGKYEAPKAVLNEIEKLMAAKKLTMGALVAIRNWYSHIGSLVDTNQGRFSGSLSKISKEKYNELINILKENILSEMNETTDDVLKVIDKNKIVDPDRPAGSMPTEVITLFKRYSLDGRFSVGCYMVMKQWYELCSLEEKEKGEREEEDNKEAEVEGEVTEEIESDEEYDETTEALERAVGTCREAEEEEVIIFEEEEMDEEAMAVQEKARKCVADTLGSGPYAVHSAFRRLLTGDCKSHFWDKIAWENPRKRGYLIERRFQTEEERYAYIQGLEDAKLSRYSCLLDEDIFHLISVYEDIDEAMYDLMLACREAEGEQKKKLQEALLKLKRIRDRRRG